MGPTSLVQKGEAQVTKIGFFVNLSHTILFLALNMSTLADNFSDGLRSLAPTKGDRGSDLGLSDYQTTILYASIDLSLN